MRTFLSATTALAWRELVRFGRQPSRIVGAAGSPLVFWILIGSGFSGSFRLPGAPREVDFLEYFYPGTLVLVVLFAAIFSTISVIEDRREGFLQGVLAAPVPRPAIAAGKILGGAALAWLQGVLFLVLAPLAGLPVGPGRLAAAAAVLALLAVGLTALGFVFAWRLDSTQGFHAIMNLVLVPLWLLSGAFFPVAGGPAWLGWVMRINPLTYGVEALRGVLGGAASGPGLPSVTVCLLVTGAATVATGLLAGAAVGASGRKR